MSSEGERILNPKALEKCRVFPVTRASGGTA